MEIDGEHYWDGGVVSNTPLAQVVGAENMRDTLAFQVDLWPARGGLPTSLEEVAERQKDIQYSSRTRLVTDQLRRVLKLRHGLQKLLARLPESGGAADLEELRRLSHTPATNIVNPDLRVQAPRALFQGLRVRHEAMREHWESGLSDIRLTWPGRACWTVRPRTVVLSPTTSIATASGIDRGAGRMGKR